MSPKAVVPIPGSTRELRRVTWKTSILQALPVTNSDLIRLKGVQELQFYKYFSGGWLKCLARDWNIDLTDTPMSS